MIRPPEKTKPHGGNRRASERVGTGQGSNGLQHNPEVAGAVLQTRIAMQWAAEQLNSIATATDAHVQAHGETLGELAAGRAEEAQQ